MIKNPLTKSRKKMIERWLRLKPFDRGFECPFLHDIRRRTVWDDSKYCEQTCKKLFPRTKIVHDGGITCPCDQLTFRHVEKMARQFIR